MMSLQNNIVSTSLIFCVLFFCGCSKNETSVPQRVCSIYEQMQSIASRPVNQRESALVGLMQEEMPVFYEENFQFFMDVEWNRKPETMRRLLGMIEGNEDYVLCDPIKDYYSKD